MVTAMPLLMVDLDNTLVDRDAAFRRAVRRFLTTHGLPFEELAWAMAVDEGGYAPRGDVATAMSRRWSGRVRAEDVGELLRSGGAPFVTLEPETEVALRRAVAAGWTTVVVTNGTVEQQLSKLRVSGLDRIVAGWIVSEALGYRKPEPEIFAAAADAVGRTLGGAWMIGDSAHADIAGARAAGVSSVWLSRERSWPADLAYRPDRIATTFAEAIDQLPAPDPLPPMPPGP